MKMTKNGLKWLFALLCLTMTAGCAAQKAYYTPVDVMASAKSAGLVQKVDNVDVLFDKSDSMNHWYGRGTGLEIAKQTTREMVQTIPADLKLNSGLRLFGAEGIWEGEKTWLVYGMAAFKNDDFLKSMDKIGNRGLGLTPMGPALMAAGNDLKGAGGKSAIILVSDFEDIAGVEDMITSKSVIDAVVKLKADYGNKLCIYPIQIGDDPDAKALAEQIVAEAGCGFLENAGNLVTPAAMGAYVQKVFFGPAPPLPPAPPAPIVEDKKAPEEAKPEVKAEAKAPAPAPAAAVVTRLDSIYFDFDKYSLKPEAKEILKKNAEWLLKNQDKKIVVEGHCDERGTAEYNMALGQRRADNAAMYLVDLGVAKDRVTTISYGKERPVCMEANEQCWSKNRRGDFIVKP
jgi:OmpA-OmpF porin, OOP family